MKKLKVFIILFLFLFMVLFIDSGVAQADYFVIDNTGDLVYGSDTHVTSNNIVVDTNGYYYIFTWNDTSPYDFELLKSVDEGNNWVKSTEFDMSNDYNMQPDGISTYIDDDDIIHIAYMYGDGSGFNVSYRNYNTGTDTISNKLHIYSDGNSDSWNGICVLKNDDDEIAVSWLQMDGSYNNATLRIKVYNDQMDSWGDTDIIYYYTTGGDCKLYGLSGDILSNGTFVYSFMYYLTTPVYRLRCAWYDDETFAHGVYFSQLATSTIAQSDFTDIAVDGDDDIHIVWESGNLAINYTYYDGTEYNEVIGSITGVDDDVCPQIAINTDNIIQIVFEFDNAGTPSDWIGGVYGSYGDWSDLQYYNSGLILDNMGYPKIIYQNLQDFTHLEDGVVGYFANETDDSLIHFDEGYELFYGGTGGTSEQGFPQCETSGWIIEKQFSDSIGYYNDTLAFVIKRTTPLFGIYAIMNSTFDVVQTGSFYGATYPTWYFVDPQYGTGTYYIVAGYTWDVWAVNCSFTIVTKGSVSDFWILESTKPTFNVGEDVILRYVIPSGEYGNITVTEDGDPLETLTLSNILGTGGYETISFGVSQVGDLCYHAYLRNASNNVLMASTPQFCIGESYFDYDIFVNGEKEVSVTAKDTVSISGYVQGIKSDVYIFMVYDNITRYSWAIGDATNKILFARNWRIDYNYTLGDEVYYLFLGTSYGLFEDKYVTLTVSDYEGEPTPFDDGSWYGLPFWLPYLIGVFLTLFVTMSPLILATYITKNTRIDRVNIPPLLYVGFFFFGLIISVAIGFLPIWLPFIILFGMITYFAVQWLYGQKGSIAGE